MRRLLAALAAVMLALGLGMPDLPATATQDTAQQSGDGVNGTFHDYHFMAADHEMYAWWAVGHTAILPEDKVWSAAYLSIKSKSSLIDAAGDHFCIQVAIDWRVPSGYDHHDARVLRNCDGNSLATWTIDEEKLNDNCPRANTVQPCISPMGRVQFSRYYPGSQHVNDPTVCRAMAGVAFNDCTTWEPWCNLDVCRMKVRRQDGSVDIVGSLYPTAPFQKSGRPSS